MKLKLSHLIIVSVSFAAGANAAEAIRGAAAVLKGVEEAAAKANDTAPESEAAKLAAALERFKGEGGNLDSKTAAQRWIEIVTKYTETPPDRASLRQGKTLSAGQVIAALPPPSAWQELATAIRARTVPKESQVRIRETALQLLAATLAGDTAGRQKLLAEIESAGPTVFGERYLWQTIQHALDDLALRSTSSPEELVSALERRISRADPESGDTDVQVPDIVPLIGEEKAEAFFRRALTNKVELKFDHEGESTRKLARKVAASMMPLLKVPQWSLANSIEAVELFEAMQTRFQKQDAGGDKRFRGMTTNSRPQKRTIFWGSSSGTDMMTRSKPPANLDRSSTTRCRSKLWAHWNAAVIRKNWRRSFISF